MEGFELPRLGRDWFAPNLLGGWSRYSGVLDRWILFTIWSRECRRIFKRDVCAFGFSYSLCTFKLIPLANGIYGFYGSWVCLAGKFSWSSIIFRCVLTCMDACITVTAETIVFETNLFKFIQKRSSMLLSHPRPWVSFAWLLLEIEEHYCLLCWSTFKSYVFVIMVIS